MKGTLYILSAFVFGIFMGLLYSNPETIEQSDVGKYVLFFLMFLVGLSLGADKNSLQIFKILHFSILAIPLITIVGTFLGVSAISLFINGISIKDIWAIGAGYGYYSLSSIYISEMRTEILGTVALLSNILREIITLVFTPLMVRYFNKLAPIVSGGATSMDTTLPIISQYCGHEFTIISVFHGTTLTILVPVIVTFFLSI
ncbi:MAG TPA: lysine exporter LysO family protein [Salinivirgaceae bacterium]|nr:lysine exporter LysO family protein [Salinivirgaceae bacterium]